MSSAARIAATAGSPTTPALWAKPVMGSWRRHHHGRAEIRRAYAPHYELAIAKRSAALSVENSLCRDATDSEVNGLGFSVGSTVRRRATDIMESGTTATQAEPIDFAADQPLGPPPAPHYQLLPIRHEL